MREAGFCGARVIQGITDFKQKADVIITSRKSGELEDVERRYQN